MTRNEWFERGTVCALALILIGIGLRDLGSYRREQQRGGRFNAGFVDLIDADDAADQFRASSFLRTPSSRILVEGLAGVERDRASGRFRHGLGPATRLFVFSDSATAELAFRVYNGIEGQDITVRLNDEILESVRAQPIGELSRHYPLALRAGDSNIVRIEYARYNHHGALLAPDDPRRLAVTFSQLSLRFR